MSDEKKKCSGCGREVTGDIGWCMSCRSILYTDLLIARTDFSGSQFKTLVFPVRDIIWMQDRIRLREAELKAADDTNDMIAAELARLRTDLAEARADVARFEAALDVANRELAEARADVARFEAALDVANRELAEARRERDEALHEVSVRDSIYAQAARTFVDHASLIIKYDRQRRTIRALVVAARGMNYAILRALVGWGVPPSDKLAKQATTRIKYGIMRTREAEKE